MARYTGPVCRLCRREGTKLFLKGIRCYTPKCIMEKKAVAPGQRSRRRTKISEYALQLREKQKAKRMAGVLERQFRRYFHMAEKKKGLTGENLLLELELRFDNVVFRLGFSSSKREARQLIRHRHFSINGKIVDIPSYGVKVQDKITLREKSKENIQIKSALEESKKRGLPSWLEFDEKKLEGTVLNLPNREEMSIPVQEQLIVELYSK
ncbi:30S ribosomal protein S4 [bacterium]|nr:30S ribosomal protein S4 [bacterium]